MTIIEALKERLEDDYLGSCTDEGYNYGVKDCINALDSFQSERTWHDPGKKLPEDGAEVWVEWQFQNHVATNQGVYTKEMFVGSRGIPFGQIIRWTPRYVDTPPPTEEEG